MEAESHGPERRTPRSIHGKVTKVTARDNEAEPMTAELALRHRPAESAGEQRSNHVEKKNDQQVPILPPQETRVLRRKISCPSVKGRGRGRS